MGENRKGNKKEDKCVVGDLKVSIWLNIFSPVSVVQPSRFNPSWQLSTIHLLTPLQQDGENRK